MKVENNKDDVLSKGYPVSKMLIVLSTVFICQDSQRACIHFVCSKQMGSLSLSLSSISLTLSLSFRPCIRVRLNVFASCSCVPLFMQMLCVCGVHIACVSLYQSAGPHMFACNDPIAHCKKRETAFSSEGDVSNNVMMGETQRIRILS